MGNRGSKRIGINIYSVEIERVLHEHPACWREQLAVFLMNGGEEPYRPWQF
jgi:hypothetical protein